jgi:diguanylate cyclase (GGDEF)-like protein/PAS domain S-box-containing protein
MTIDPALPPEPRSIDHLKTLYDQAARLAKIGAWECDLSSETLTWTDGVYDLFDFARGSTIRRPWTVEMYEDESRREMERLRAEAIRTGRGFAMDARIRTNGGASRWMRLTAEIAYAQGRPARIFGAKQDITHEKEMWDRLRSLAEQDALTGLANRRVFETRCAELATRCAHDGSAAALALIDLDRFKEINDRLGHAAGDECLRQVGLRLQRVLGEAVVIARIGGDEFAALLHDPLGRAPIAAALDRALRALRRPVLWRSTQIPLGASIGATWLTRAFATGPAQLFAEADSALYVAKAAGRSVLRIFGAEIATRGETEMMRRMAS